MPVLPKPYPDEVIGSVVVRACRHTGLPMRRLLQSIFESQRSSCSFLLGNDVANFAYRCGLAPRELLFNHTMFQYAIAYMPPLVQEHLTSKALAPRPREDSLSSLTKNVSHGVAYRRVCKMCIADNIQQYGESYWHRKHMLPGVHVCLRDGEPLFETNIELRRRSHVSSVVLPHEVLDKKQPASVLSRELSVRIAAMSIQALEGDTPRSQDWLRFYRERAKTLGYLRPSGDVAGSLVAHLLRNHFGNEYLLMAGCPVADDPRNGWPALMFRPSREASFATPKHVLMNVFLGTVPMNIEDPKKVYRAPGKRTRDYAQMDATTVIDVRARMQQLALNKQRVTVRELLLAAGAWAAFKHHRAQFTKTAALLEEFKRSDLSQRQVGGRPYWRKRLPSRYPAVGVELDAQTRHTGDAGERIKGAGRDVLYIDFDGVLNQGFTPPRLDGYLSAPPDSQLFQHAELLERLLVPYPRVALVLNNSWVRKFGYSKIKEQLPLSLRARVIGATLHSHMNEFKFAELQRGQQVFQDVLRRNPARWLVLGNDATGLPNDFLHSFVNTDVQAGISARQVINEMIAKLTRFGEAT